MSSRSRRDYVVSLEREVNTLRAEVTAWRTRFQAVVGASDPATAARRVMEMREQEREAK